MGRRPSASYGVLAAPTKLTQIWSGYAACGWHCFWASRDPYAPTPLADSDSLSIRTGLMRDTRLNELGYNLLARAQRRISVFT
jgi:hypothetical protein